MWQKILLSLASDLLEDMLRRILEILIERKDHPLTEEKKEKIEKELKGE